MKVVSAALCQNVPECASQKKCCHVLAFFILEGSETPLCQVRHSGHEYKIQVNKTGIIFASY